MARILLATDGSELATHAARTATELLGATHEYTALVVVPPPPAAVPVGEAGVAPMVDPAVSEAQTEALSHEAEVVLQLVDEATVVPVTPKVAHGDPGRTICDVAAEFDVVVVASHGTGFFRRLLIGSVSNHVLHHAPCPVLVVREEND
jgi:nucleotide-binding universal stress UspA family protein